MATTGTPAAAIAAAYSRRSCSNRRGHAGSYLTTKITPVNLHSAALRPGTPMPVTAAHRDARHQRASRHESMPAVLAEATHLQSDQRILPISCS